MVSFDASLSAVLHDMWVEVFYVLSHLYREMAFMSCRGSTVDLWRKGAMLTPGGAKAGAKGALHLCWLLSYSKGLHWFPGFHRPGRHCLHRARSAVRCWASRIKGELHSTKNLL